MDKDIPDQSPDIVGLGLDHAKDVTTYNLGPDGSGTITKFSYTPEGTIVTTQELGPNKEVKGEKRTLVKVESLGEVTTTAKAP